MPGRRQGTPASQRKKIGDLYFRGGVMGWFVCKKGERSSPTLLGTFAYVLNKQRHMRYRRVESAYKRYRERYDSADDISCEICELDSTSSDDDFDFLRAS